MRLALPRPLRLAGDAGAPARARDRRRRAGRRATPTAAPSHGRRRLGTVEIAHLPERQSLAATIRFPGVRALPAIIARVRRVFDLGADVAAIGAHLARDPLLAPLVAARPGLRVPGGWDGFELAVRAVLGQQVSVAGRPPARGPAGARFAAREPRRSAATVR